VFAPFVSDDRDKKVNKRLSPPVIFSAAIHVAEYLRLRNFQVLDAQFSWIAGLRPAPSQPLLIRLFNPKKTCQNQQLGC
jgi:hypothetical protein